jgi:glutathione S-transferase
MKLHTFLPSPNSVKVLALIHQLGLDVEFVHIDLTKGERVDLSINPNGKIPTLEDGEQTLWESQAIMQYLAEKHDSGLLPKDLVQRAKMNQWMSWNLAHFGAAIAGVIWEKVAPKMMPGYEADQHNLDKSMTELARYGKVLDDHMKDRKFVLGDEPSLADISMAAPLIHLQMAELELNDFPHVMSWFGRVMELPYFQKALPPAPVGV